MKVKKLNARGFSHEIVLVAVVVFAGIAGSAFLVLSHADSCSGGASDPTTGPMSGVSDPVTGNCDLDSGPTTGPASTTVAAKCTIDTLPKGNLSAGTTPVFNVTVSNTGTTTISPQLTTQLTMFGSVNHTTIVNKGVLSYGQLAANQSATKTYSPGYTVPQHPTSQYGMVRASISGKLAFQCAKTFALPNNGR